MPSRFPTETNLQHLLPLSRCYSSPSNRHLTSDNCLERIRKAYRTTAMVPELSQTHMRNWACVTHKLDPRFVLNQDQFVCLRVIFVYLCRWLFCGRHQCNQLHRKTCLQNYHLSVEWDTKLSHYSLTHSLSFKTSRITTVLLLLDPCQPEAVQFLLIQLSVMAHMTHDQKAPNNNFTFLQFAISSHIHPQL